MASQKTKFSVGLFLAAGLGIALVAFIWLGMSRYLEKGRYYVTYFNESVQGLNKDSPVKYRGVTIGRVDSIGVAPDSKLIKVVMVIESGQTLGSDIVAQLKAVGITGSMFVELDQKKEGEPDRTPTLTFPSEYPMVASKPSEITELFRGVDEVLKNIQGLDLEGISGKIKLTLDTIHLAVSSADIKALSEKFAGSLDRLNRILHDPRWDRIMASADKAGISMARLMEKGDSTLNEAENVFGQARKTLALSQVNLENALLRFQKAMENTNTLMEKGAALVNHTDDTVLHLSEHLLATARNLEKASENLDRLIELVSDQPSQLLLSDPPARRVMEPPGE